MKFKPCFAYFLLVIVFFLIRIFYHSFSPALNEVDFQGLSIISLNLFQILKNVSFETSHLPLYYFVSHFVFVIFKSSLAIKIFNSIITLFSCFVLMKIGKKNFSNKMGIFLFLFFTINHFFVYQTSLIAPYCLNFLVFLLLFDSLIDFIKKPKEKTAKKLCIFNIIYLLADSFSILFLCAEFLVLYFWFYKKEKYKKILIVLSRKLILPFALILPIFLVQIYINSTMLIPKNPNAIALNFNSLYLLINEFITPYLSFDIVNVSQSTLGMLYSYFLNPNLENLNSLKILITLFYSSILPLFFILFFALKTALKSKKYRIIFLCGILVFVLYLILVSVKFLELNPIYIFQAFFIFIFLFSISLFELKDRLIKGILIFCLFLIQFINPNLNTFYLSINKNFPINLAFDSFSKEYALNSEDLVISPYLSKYFALYYKNLRFFDFDYSYFKRKGKDGVVENLLTYNSLQKINKRNIYFLSQDYLLSGANNEFFARKFFDDYLKNDVSSGRIIFVVDKMNSKPLPNSTINKFASKREYNLSLRKIDFNNLKQLNKNTSKQFYDVLTSKSLYNIIYLLNNDLSLVELIEYKLVDGKVYKILKQEKNIYSAINSYQSDYVIVIYKKRVFN